MEAKKLKHFENGVKAQKLKHLKIEEVILLYSSPKGLRKRYEEIFKNESEEPGI